MNLQLTWELQAENPNFLLLKIENEPWKEVYRPIFKNYLKELKLCSTRETLEEKFSALENRLSKIECLRLLSLKGYLSKELEEKLKRKGFSKKATIYALGECRRLQFLDDTKESERLAERLQRKGYGARLIAAKMREKGAEYSPEFLQDPKEAIQKLVGGKLKNYPREKVIATLCRRGFEYHAILDVLKIQDPL